MLIFISAFPYFFNSAVNTLYIKNKVSLLIHTRTGIHLDPARFTLRAFPKPGIILNDFSFMPDQKMNFEISRLEFNIALQPLLHGKMVIGHVFLRNPKISLPLRNSQHPESLFKFKPDEFKKAFSKIFQYLPEDQETLEIKVINAISSYFNRMDGSLILSRATKDITASASINKLEIHASDLSQTSLEQYLDLDSIILDQLKFSVSINSKFEIRAELDGKGLMTRSVNKDILFDSNTANAFLNLSDTGYQLDIKPFKINYPDGVVGVHFFSDPAHKKSEIQFTGNDIHIDQAKKMSLAIFKKSKFVNDLFGILQDGISPDINVSFRADDPGLLFKAGNLELKGRIENGVVKIPRTDLIVSNIEGRAEIQTGILDINATRAVMSSSVIKQGKLAIDLLGFNHVPFNGNFFLDVDLSAVPETLASLLPETLLVKELAKTHNITGRSNVRLDLSIPKDSRELDVKIDSDDFSIKGNYDRIPGPLSLERINFKYSSGMVHLNHVQGTLAGIIIDDLDCRLDLKEEPSISIQSGSGRIFLDSAFPFLMSGKKIKDFLSPLKNAKGKIDITSIRLSGPVLMPEKWAYDITGKGNQLDLTTQLNQREIGNLSCQYHFSDSNFSLEKISAKIENLSWLEPLVGEKHLDSFRTPLNMENGQFQTDKKKSIFSSDLYFPDGQKLQIEVDGDNLKSLALKKIILLDTGFSNAFIALSPDTDKTIFDFNGILNTKTINKLLIPDSDLEKKMNDLTEGESVLIHTDKDSTLHIQTKKINLTSYLSAQKSFSTKNPLFSNKTVKLKTENLTIKNWTIKDIDAELSFKHDDTYIRLNKAFLCDLETKGYIDFKNDRVDARIPFNAVGKDNIQTLLTCLLNKNDFMDGRYSFTGEIISDTLKQNLLNTLNGSFLFQAQEGRVYKLTLLSRILSVLNVSNFFKGSLPDITQKGFAYQTISIDADIKDSIIHITKAIVDGNDMTIIFTGRIDLINDYMDLTCLVAPFKTIDLIIEKIPIVSTLMGGNLISVPVKASGKISDPAVVPLHPSAVGDGLINMMANILKTPVRLLDKISDDDKQKDGSASEEKQ